MKIFDYVNDYKIELIVKMVLFMKFLFLGVCIVVLLYGILDVLINYE